MPSTKDDDRATTALAIVVNAIGDPTIRRQFADKPKRTLKRILEQEGAQVKDLPRDVRGFLEDLTYEELRLISHLETTLEDAGLKIEVGPQNAHTIGKL